MFALTLWNILGIISILCLIVSFFIIDCLFIQSGFIAGMFISILLIIITYLKDGVVNWILIKDVLTVFVLLGALLEGIARIMRFEKDIKL